MGVKAFSSAVGESKKGLHMYKRKAPRFLLTADLVEKKSDAFFAFKYDKKEVLEVL